MHMEFDKGMAGVLVVVLSLIASVGLGVITNIDTTTVSKDVDEYVADITGGLTYDKEKSYINYNPSKNYNGYTNSTIDDAFPVQFTEASTVNNYPITFTNEPIEYDLMSSSASNLTFGYGTDITYNPSLDNFCYYQIFGANARIYGSEYNSGGAIRAMKFTDLLSDITPVDTTNLLSINFTVYATKEGTEESNHPGNMAAIVSGDVFKKSGENWFLAPQSFGTTPYVYGYTTGTPYYNLPVGESVDLLNITYNLSSNLCTYYRASDGSTIQVSNPNDVYVFASNIVGITTTESTASKIRIAYVYSGNTGYIDTRYGINIMDRTSPTPEQVTWANNQENGVTDIAFSIWNENRNEFTDHIWDPVDEEYTSAYINYSNTAVLHYANTNLTDTFTISRTDGFTSISLNGGVAIPIGTWNQIQLKIDSISGILTVYPIQTWDNFNNYTLAGTSIQIGTLNIGNLTDILWTVDNPDPIDDPKESFRMQVINTQVFFNSYGVVMVNPRMTVENLWPNYTKFTIDIDKVATVGDSVTFGNTTFIVISNILNAVSIEDGNTIYTPTGINVTDMDLHYSKSGNQWELEITSGKNTLDLTVPNTYIELSGAWYFTMGFYQTITKDVTERQWNPSTYNWFESHMFFWMAGFVLLLGLGAYKLGYLDSISILIIIASEFILIIIGGVS